MMHAGNAAFLLQIQDKREIEELMEELISSEPHKSLVLFLFLGWFTWLKVYHTCKGRGVRPRSHSLHVLHMQPYAGSRVTMISCEANLGILCVFLKKVLL